MFRNFAPCTQWRTVIREKPIAIYIHNSSNDTSRLSSSLGKLPKREEWKGIPSRIAPFVEKKFFFLCRGNNGEQTGQIDKAYKPLPAAAFAELLQRHFARLKLQRDFHKTQRRAENMPVICRDGAERGEGEEKARRGATKWKGNFAIHAVKTHGAELSLSSLSVSPRPHRDSLRVSKSEKILATSSLRSILRSLCIVS